MKGRVSKTFRAGWSVEFKGFWSTKTASNLGCMKNWRFSLIVSLGYGRGSWFLVSRNMVTKYSWKWVCNRLRFPGSQLHIKTQKFIEWPPGLSPTTRWEPRGATHRVTGERDLPRACSQTAGYYNIPEEKKHCMPGGTRDFKKRRA